MKYMSEGTKSILFGSHSIIHSILVYISWVILYKSLPSFKETVCILIHDIGYIGMNYVTDKSNEGHAELGAYIAKKLFGPTYEEFVLGHSSAAQRKFCVVSSKLEKPDEYSWIIAPIWWIKWNMFLEGFKVDPVEYKKAIKENFYAKNRKSGTEIFTENRL